MTKQHTGNTWPVCTPIIIHTGEFPDCIPVGGKHTICMINGAFDVYGSHDTSTCSRAYRVGIIRLMVATAC